MEPLIYKRGEIYLASLDPVVGSEQGGIPMEQCQLPSEIVGSQTNSVSTVTMSVHPCAVGV